MLSQTSADVPPFDHGAQFGFGGKINGLCGSLQKLHYKVLSHQTVTIHAPARMELIVCGTVAGGSLKRRRMRL
jgi:hypothetical protein